MFLPLLFGGLSAILGASSANKAANAQTASAQMGIEEQKRQFDAIQKLLAPYVTQGTAAFGAQGNLVGLNGAEAQKAAIQGIQNGPQFQALLASGSDAMRQNAAATGGLRGGNFQAAMAQFAPQLLSQQIGQQFANLGGMAGAGLGAATSTGTAGQNMAGAVSGLYGQQGAAQAGGALAGGAAWQGLLSGLGSYVGQFGTGGGMNVGAPGSLLGGNSWGF